MNESRQLCSSDRTQKSNVYFDGKCISHTIVFEDGTKKNLRIVLPTDDPLEFKTHAPERIEIVSGECEVRIANDDNREIYRAGQSFFIPGDSQFELKALNVVDYICHFEG